MPGVEEEIKAWVADYIRASGEMYKGCTDDTYKEFASKFTSEDMTFIRPSGNPMNMTGFKEIFLLKARRASVEETPSYDDESVGCDFELLERREAGRGHSGSAVDARVRGHSPRRPLTSPCPSLSAEQPPPARRPQSSTPPQGRHARDVRGVMPQ